MTRDQLGHGLPKGEPILRSQGFRCDTLQRVEAAIKLLIGKILKPVHDRHPSRRLLKQGRERLGHEGAYRLKALTEAHPLLSWLPVPEPGRVRGVRHVMQTWQQG